MKSMKVFELEFWEGFLVKSQRELPAAFLVESLDKLLLESLEEFRVESLQEF